MSSASSSTPAWSSGSGAGPVLQGPRRRRLRSLRAGYGRPPGQGGGRTGPAHQGTGRRGSVRPPAPSALSDPALRVGLVASPGYRGVPRLHGRCTSRAWPSRSGRRPPTCKAEGWHPVGWRPPSPRLSGEALDIIVVVRGGGSKADLATFDAESVARAVADCRCSGVDRHRTHGRPGRGRRGGQPVLHHPDRMRSGAGPISEGLSGGRVSMPVSLWDGWPANGWRPPSGLLDRHRHTTITCARSQLDRHGERLVHRSYTLRAAAQGPSRRPRSPGRQRQIEDLVKSSRRSVAGGQERMADRTRRLVYAVRASAGGRGCALGQWRRLLGAYDYRRQLERGYSVTRDAGGTVVRSTHDVEPGAVLFTHVVDGEVVSTVADPVAPDAPLPAARREPPVRRGRMAMKTKGTHDGDDVRKRREEGGDRPRGGSEVAELSYASAGQELDTIIEEFETGSGRRRPAGGPVGAGHPDRGRAGPATPAYPDARGGTGPAARSRWSGRAVRGRVLDDAVDDESTPSPRRRRRRRLF